MLSLVLGFLAPFIPDVLGMFKAGQDHKHEKEMLQLRQQGAEDEHTWRMDAIHAQADIAEMKAVRRPHKSYGVQLLDKAAEAENVLWKWSFNLVFLSFAVLDWLISSVRPGITYWFFGLYALNKTAIFTAVYDSASKFAEGVFDAAMAAAQNAAVWTEFDQEMLRFILGFWFGERMRRRSQKGE